MLSCLRRCERSLDAAPRLPPPYPPCLLLKSYRARSKPRPTLLLPKPPSNYVATVSTLSSCSPKCSRNTTRSFLSNHYYYRVYKPIILIIIIWRKERNYNSGRVPHIYTRIVLGDTWHDKSFLLKGDKHATQQQILLNAKNLVLFSYRSSLVSSGCPIFNGPSQLEPRFPHVPLLVGAESQVRGLD